MFPKVLSKEGAAALGAGIAFAAVMTGVATGSGSASGQTVTCANARADDVPRGWLRVASHGGECKRREVAPARPGAYEPVPLSSPSLTGLARTTPRTSSGAAAPAAKASS